MLTEFRQFILRGNLVDLAVAVVIGTAFSILVAAFVRDLINSLLSFVLVSAVLFFLVVKPVNALMERYRTEPPTERETQECRECLSEIPVAARRCSFCTAEQPAGV